MCRIFRQILSGTRIKLAGTLDVFQTVIGKICREDVRIILCGQVLSKISGFISLILYHTLNFKSIHFRERNTFWRRCQQFWKIKIKKFEKSIDFYRQNCYNNKAVMLIPAEVAEWQTRYFEGVVGVFSCGFKSHSPHHVALSPFGFNVVLFLESSRIFEFLKKLILGSSIGVVITGLVYSKCGVEFWRRECGKRFVVRVYGIWWWLEIGQF